MILMHRLLVFVQSLFTSSPPVGTTGFEFNEPARDTKDLQDDHHPFLELPLELLLVVASFLDRESQALLSLSCRRLRVTLDCNLDLSPCDRNVKLRFLRYLELDYPEYLTCRSCACLFKWQGRRRMGYRCPRVDCHSLEDRLMSYAWHMGGFSLIIVTRDIFNLIFRAHDRGQRYGLPLSVLSTSGTGYLGVTHTNEARLVDGQLLLATRWEADLESGHEIARKARFFNAALCLHLGLNVYREKTWQYVEKAVAGMTGLEKPRLYKCAYCASDYKLSLQKSTAGRTRIVLIIWRNYGQPYENMLANEQVFHRDPASRIDADALRRRDIQAVFESYRSGI